ncbi:MAG TPA: energy transducer TonB [Kiritimatiellia bacterium]|nr:energy transducer TonB [Kiritimatiellia bacterium]HMO98798.1 energy transducer TonB [Kiritimatiellia bacterium]HMP96869.1 energy transducer TonB [Kiritimatiellia bacterium]
MTSRFNKAFKVSLALHGTLLAVLVIAPLFSTCARKKPKEQILFVEMVSPAPPAPTPPAPTPPPPRPEPPKPEPPKPEPPKPEPPPPEPTPRVVQPREIKVNTNRIIRRDTPPPTPTPPKPTLTPEQLQKQLLASLPASSTPSPSAGSPTELQAYYGTIQRILYAAWEQPPGVAGLNTRVSIRIARNGAIMQRNLLSGSGSPAMDDSVMRALRAVSTLPQLPASVRDAFLDVTITFESTGLSL